jgi:predicted SAM-dependent methyltransferase
MKKLHLWCWKRYIPEFIHIDALKYEHIDYQADISKLEMFEENSVDLIYACHVLEHFWRKEILDVLKEWNRVIKKWWILRISVPWFEECIKIYNKYNDINQIIGPIMWGQRDQYDFHKMLFDFNNISSLLKEAWFKTINKYNWKDTEHADIDDYSQAYIPHMDKENGLLVSLNIEAIK